jgi:hypothetical protein
LRDAYEIKREMEAEYAAVLGEAGLQALKDALLGLLQSESPPERSEKDGTAH